MAKVVCFVKHTCTPFLEIVRRVQAMPQPAPELKRYFRLAYYQARSVDLARRAAGFELPEGVVLAAERATVKKTLSKATIDLRV